MSAELVDPFATHEPNLTPEEWQAIRDEVYDRHWGDGQLRPDIITETLRTLGEIGMGNSANPARDATQCLRRVAHRAESGVPYGEPEEPVFPRCTAERCKQTALSGSCRDCS